MKPPLAEEDLAALVALATLPGVGPASLHGWLDSGGAVAAWHAAARGRPDAEPVLRQAAARLRTGTPSISDVAAQIDPASLLQRHRDLGIEVLVHDRIGYPTRLIGDPSPPALVFVDGSLRGLDAPVVAIVGTRNATRLGCDTAGRLAVDLARAGVTIASGLALGIDGAAHAAMVLPPGAAPPEVAPPGPPIAVVAAGLDRRYPRAHARLHDRIAACGAVLGEVPVGVGPSRWRFPARNRILAGLADAVVVVESRSAGGSMLTVAEALARDVPVLAVPGHPTAPAAAGTLDLICDGATPVRDAQDVLVALGWGGADATSPIGTGRRSGVGLPSAGGRWGAALVAELASGPCTLAQLLERTGASMDEASEALVELELAGEVTRTGTWYEARALAPERSAGRGR